MKVEIDRLGHHGDGIAEGPIFVARVLPGEEVEGDLDDGRLTGVRVLTPSEDRVSPPCTHYKMCGGCSLQHANDAFVARWKEGVIHMAMVGQGIEAPIRPIVTSPPGSRRRAALSARRTKKGAMVGFHGRASDQLVAAPSCKVLHPDILAFFPALERLTVMGASRSSEITIYVTQSAAGVDVAVVGGKEMDRALQMELADWCRAPGLARLTWNDDPVAEIAPPLQSFGAALVSPPPGAFLQATVDGEAALVEAVREVLKGAKHVVDLFSGSGTLTLPLAGQAEVHGVENDTAMLAALDRGWREAKGLRRVSTEARDLFRRPLMPDELGKFDGAVIDPPRAGAKAQIAELAQSGIARVAMVSCNPITFARDARALIDGGYKLNWVQPVDQFRWSSHVELAASFSRA